MKIEVTAEDIQNGTPNEMGCCPIALAVRRATGKPYVSVGAKNVEIGTFTQYTENGTKLGGGPENRLDLPNEATLFILDFDSGVTVQPFAFDLLLPSELEATNVA